jgi:outer membrane protein assembly factor BamB
MNSPGRISRRGMLKGLVTGGLALVGGVGCGMAREQQLGQTTPEPAKKWSYRTGGYITSSPAVANGMVYVGSEDHNLYALDAASGHKHWSYETGDSISFSSPAVANGMVYVGSEDHNLYALDAASGRKHWSYQTKGFIDSSPAVVKGIVYVGSTDGSLYALDAASGRKQWSYQTGYYVASSPTVVNGVVYVGSDDHSLYAIALPRTTP